MRRAFAGRLSASRFRETSSMRRKPGRKGLHGYNEGMSTRPSSRRKNPVTGLYYPNLVPLSAIRRYARHIAERFQPDKIILFGSYAYGTPTPDSDVDLLVVMPTNNQIEQ